MTSPTRNSDNAQALVDSIVYVGPKGTTLPTDLTTAPGAALKDLGWLTDTGIGEAVSSNLNTRRGINGAPVKVIKADDDTSFTFECYERNAITLGLIRPGSTATTTAGVNTTRVKAYTGADDRTFLFHKDFGAWQQRIGIPSGRATLTGTITDKPGDLPVLQFRVDPNPASDGTKFIDINNNPAEAVT